MTTVQAGHGNALVERLGHHHRVSPVHCEVTREGEGAEVGRCGCEDGVGQRKPLRRCRVAILGAEGRWMRDRLGNLSAPRGSGLQNVRHQEVPMGQ